MYHPLRLARQRHPFQNPQGSQYPARTTATASLQQKLELVRDRNGKHKSSYRVRTTSCQGETHCYRRQHLKRRPQPTSLRKSHLPKPQPHRAPVNTAGPPKPPTQPPYPPPHPTRPRRRKARTPKSSLAPKPPKPHPRTSALSSTSRKRL
jgi:hypothetical protein